MSEMSAIDRVAVLLITLPSDLSSKIIQNMDEKYIKDVVSRMYSLKDLKEEDCMKVIEEFYQSYTESRSKISFSKENVKAILEMGLGHKKSSEILKDIYKDDPFEYLKTIPVKNIFEIVKNEPPAVVAIVVGNLNPEQSVEFMSYMDDKMRKEVLKKIKKSGAVKKEIVFEIGKNIKEALSSSSKKSDISSADKVAEIISFMSRQDMEKSLNSIKEEDPEFYEEVYKKMVTFDKIVEIEDKLVQKIIRAIDQKTLAVSLKGATQAVSEKVYRNMTEDAAKAIMEDIETLPNMSEKSVDDARRKFAKAMKQVIEESKKEGAI